MILNRGVGGGRRGEGVTISDASRELLSQNFYTDLGVQDLNWRN